MPVAAVQMSPVCEPLLVGVCTGSVHSVFATSFNVELGGRLVHVGRAGDAFSCTGFSVEDDSMPGLLSGLAAGGVVTMREGTLRLYKRAGVAAIDLRRADVVSCELRAMLDASAAAWAAERLGELPLDKLVGLDLANPRCTESLRSLASPDSEEREFSAALSFLVGRGAGLTPSGDDVLLGYACARAACGNPGPSAEALAALVRGRTTDVSVSYFEALAAGLVNPVYLDVLRAAARHDRVGFDRAVRDVLAIGHTSGADALCGLALGFSYVTAMATGPVHCRDRAPHRQGVVAAGR